MFYTWLARWHTDCSDLTAMKWVITAGAAFLSVFLCSMLGAEESGPWGFQNIAIINLPFRDVEIIRSLDNHAVELHFSKWDDALEASVKLALSKSPLRYRLHPLRQTRMAVEIYSITSEVDFAAKPTAKETQVIVGEVRDEKVTADLLARDTKAVPVPDVAHMVRLGKYTSARNELYKLREKHAQGTQYLFRTRMALIDFLKRGRSALRCPYIPSVPLGDRESYEALLLNAWCKRERGESDEALNYLKMLMKGKPSPDILARASRFEQIIISGRILTMDRLNKPANAAALALKHLDVIGTSLKEISFIETVAENLIAMNLANPLASLIQKMIARDKRARVRELEPILVESYLAGSRHILAIDAANYFLFKPQSPWSKGRLLRGYGLSLMQSGDWEGAAKALQESKSLGVAWGVNEDLAVLEAKMRADAPVEELDQMLTDIVNQYKTLKGHHKRWYLRLSAEIDLRKGKEIQQSTLSKLPQFVLFKSAEQARLEGKTSRQENILGAMATQKGGWQKLADTIYEIDEMKNQIEEIEKTMEVMR